MESKIDYPVINQSGGKSGTKSNTVQLDPAVFDTEGYTRTVHTVVVAHQNQKRAGTHSSINKGEMESSNKKPWKQKGTGRARAGTTSSPLWVGGAVAHGPKPRDYSARVNKKEKALALATVLTQKRVEGEIKIVDAINVASGKTKEFVGFLQGLGIADNESCLVIVNPGPSLVSRSAGNLSNVQVTTVDSLNVYDLLNNKFLIATAENITAIENKLCRSFTGVRGA